MARWHVIASSASRGPFYFFQDPDTKSQLAYWLADGTVTVPFRNGKTDFSLVVLPLERTNSSDL